MLWGATPSADADGLDCLSSSPKWAQTHLPGNITALDASIKALQRCWVYFPAEEGTKTYFKANGIIVLDGNKPNVNTAKGSLVFDQEDKVDQNQECRHYIVIRAIWVFLAPEQNWSLPCHDPVIPSREAQTKRINCTLYENISYTKTILFFT